MNIELGAPGLGLAAVAAAVATLVIAPRRRALPHPALPLLRNLRRRELPPLEDVLHGAAMLAIAAALAAPRCVRVEPATSVGRAIAVVVDVSGSMATPIAPGRSRLDAAKEALATFLGRAPAAWWTLVAFGGDAVTVVPPTQDRALVRQALSALRPGTLGSGTALGDALLVAIARLRALGAPGMIVLVSDGAANRGVDPVTAAQAAATYRFPIVTIAWAAASAPPEDPAPVANDVLAAVAETTGGLAVRVDDPASLERALALAAERTGRIRAVPSATSSTSLVPHLAVAALVLLLTELVLRASPWGTRP